MHRASVWSLAFSPDNKELYSGSTDGEVHVWDVSTGAHVRSLVGHRRAVLDICFNDEGEAITASRDGTVRYWSPSSQQHRALRPAGGGVFAVVSAAGCTITASYDRTIRLHPAEMTLRGHGDAVTGLAVVGERLISGSRDCTTRTWDLGSGETVATQRVHSRWITKLRAADDGFVTASEDGTLAMWKLGADKPRWRRTASPFDTPVWGLDVSADGRLAVTGDASGVPRLWNLSDGVALRSFTPGSLAHRACAFSRDARFLAVGNDDGTVTVFETDTGATVWCVPGSTTGILSAVVSNDHELVVTGHANGTIKARRRVYREGSDPSRYTDGAPAPQFSGHERFVYQIRRSSTRQFVSAAFDGTIAAWDLETGSLQTRCRHRGAVFGVAAWKDGAYAATSGGGEVRVWDMTVGSLAATIRLRGEGAHSLVAAGTDGKPLVVAAESGELDVWNIDSIDAPRHIGSVDLALGTDLLSALTLTPDATQAVAATAGGRVLLVDLIEQKARAGYSCHEDWIRDVRVTPDGRQIVALCQDLALKLLELDTGSEVDTGLDTTPVAAVSIDADGTVSAVDLSGEWYVVHTSNGARDASSS